MIDKGKRSLINELRFIQNSKSRRYYMRVSTVLGAVVLVLIITNESISASRFLKVEGSYMRVFTVFGAIVLVLIIMNEAISACRFLKVEGSYMRVFTVFGAIVLA